MTNKSLKDDILQQFIQLIATNTGLCIREQDKQSLAQKILSRMKSIKIAIPEIYYQLLESNTEYGQREWQELAILLTTSESYFFRDLGQFSLLRHCILPELIEQKKRKINQESSSKPCLRIWSAGCSTGEEPYSLAILIKQLIPDWETNWDILILGTDINLETLKKAKQGIYSAWSFRLGDAKIQERYFQHSRNDWKLNEEICRMVKFQYGNLIKDSFPNHNINISDMDLIICRNVFVYFDTNSISKVLKKFYNTLKPGGYLLTGHAELQGQELGGLQTRMFGESAIYQRRDNTDAELKVHKLQVVEGLPVSRLQVAGSNGLQAVEGLQVSKLQVTGSNGLPVDRLKIVGRTHYSSEGSKQSSNLQSPTSFQALLSEAETLFKKKEYALAIKKTKQLAELFPKNFKACYLLGNIYANLGQYEKAIYYCNQALAIDSLSADIYYLLAHIAEEQGDIEVAKSYWKKIIYVAPSSVYAYLELSFIYDREGDMSRAGQMRHVAIEMLNKLPKSAIIGPEGELTAGELLIKIQKML